MEIKELIGKLRNCGGGTEGIKLVNEAANTLEKLSAENKQLRNDLIMQTALAQNGQSAIETNKQLAQQIVALKAERDAAIKDLKQALWDDEICPYCKHNYHCGDTECDGYIEGVGMTDEKGNYYDWKWSCRDFDWGTCVKLENTPCNGCDLINHFEWRGVNKNDAEKNCNK